MTIDGFSLTGDPLSGFPRVKADFAVTTYIVPAGAGALRRRDPGRPGPGGRPPMPGAGRDRKHHRHRTRGGGGAMKLEGRRRLAKNVYRDLRDRRLLSIAIVLVVAIIAVPLLIKGVRRRNAPPPPAARSGGAGRGAEVLDAASLDRGARPARLPRAPRPLPHHNPFKQQLTGVGRSGGLDDLEEVG